MDKENENRKRSTERVQMGRSRGKKRKEKRKSYRGNHSRGEKLGIKEKGEEEGCMGRKVHIGNKWWKIMTVYSKEVKTTRRHVQDAMKENRKECMFMGGDINGRIGKRGVMSWEEERRDGKTKSKNKVENAEGKRLMEWIEENRWEVLNGTERGDEEGEWTYLGSRRETVIDYGIVNEEAWERQ
jgi:hypothetical protein